MQRKAMRRSGLWVVAAIAIMAALLFFFEWLGSEQPQKWVETPIALPPDQAAAAKRR